ncbi:unnamed protein product [Paramecium primaurelia]|uniref:Uncharacterized protein n=1 Tax=Paramecium primaurelia TaxID=5886 RepID=A0A8S1PZU9_PARPR|nr:unnamed protein product [Paramecium primaurelia]
MQSQNINIYSTITYGSLLNSKSNKKKYQLIANFDILKKTISFSVLKNYQQKFIYLIILQNMDFLNILNYYRIFSFDTVTVRGKQKSFLFNYIIQMKDSQSYILYISFKYNIFAFRVVGNDIKNKMLRFQ